MWGDFGGGGPAVRIGNTANRHQGSFKKVLCVCSAGLLRSPTAAVVLSQEPFNFNTRAVGIEKSYALIHIDPVHLHWADEVVCMEQEMVDVVRELVNEHCIIQLKEESKVVNLDIPDMYAYRHPELIQMIKEKYIHLKMTPKK